MGTPAARVCILDYGSGNVRSVFNILSTLPCTVSISNQPAAIRDATHLVLPGVGAFKKAMELIEQRIPLDLVKEQALSRGKPFLGICVGMQVLADVGFEFEECRGLGWIAGRVDRLESRGLPLPHVGWNHVAPAADSPLTRGFTGEPDFYFVHSYAYSDAPADAVLGTCDYGQRFPAMIGRGNTYGVQFHPEKSQRAGRQLLENFLDVR